MPRPYDKTTHDGNTVDWLTKTALLAAEKRLGYTLTITQGSYNSSVSQSAGTHDGGGAVDLAAFDHRRKVRVLRDLGFAAWFRPAIPGHWPDHIHAIQIGNDRLSEDARDQVDSYRRGRDGLAGDNVDPNPYRPDPIKVWTMPQVPARTRAAQVIRERAKKVQRADVRKVLRNVADRLRGS